MRFPDIDILVQQKFLRKKYKDPITGGDFRVLSPMELQGLPGFGPQTGPAGSIGVGGMGPGARQPGQGSPGPGGAGQSGFRPEQFRPERLRANRAPGLAASGRAVLGDRCGGLVRAGEIRIRFVGPGRRADQPLGTPGIDRSRSVGRGRRGRRQSKQRQVDPHLQESPAIQPVDRHRRGRIAARRRDAHTAGPARSAAGTPGTPGVPTSPGGTRPSGFPSPRGPASSRIERGRLLGRRGRGAGRMARTCDMIDARPHQRHHDDGPERQSCAAGRRAVSEHQAVQPGEQHPAE